MKEDGPITKSRATFVLRTLYLPGSSNFGGIDSVMASVSSLPAGGRTTPSQSRGCKAFKGMQVATSVLRTPVACVSVNNDEEERKQRRLETHLRSAVSPGYSPGVSRLVVLRNNNRFG